MARRLALSNIFPRNKVFTKCRCCARGIFRLNGVYVPDQTHILLTCLIFEPRQVKTSLNISYFVIVAPSTERLPQLHKKPQLDGRKFTE
jgi:hypothetical protein